MKRIAISSCLAFAALSLYAAQPQTTDTAPPTAHGEKLLSSAAVGTGTTDSPLVRAAKATNRLNKKPGQVITNETLVHVGGHFTTTTPAAQTTLPSQPSTVPTMDQLSMQARQARAEAAAAADAARKLAQQKRTAAGLAAARSEGDTAEGVYTDPPALENETIQSGKPVPPEAMTQKQKPPL
ncbi:MAG TPA: hypothetical protein VHY33_01495 [Thermoanaerobaculia bacterium]|jgi:hypothetical protein|nr:hypothetical protein [Thermoanaerobaculia bacterium]